MDDPADVGSQNRPGWHLLDGCATRPGEEVDHGRHD
jgi:hypothetical protein